MGIGIIVKSLKMREHLGHGSLSLCCSRRLNWSLGYHIRAAKDCAAGKAHQPKDQHHIGKIRFCCHTLFPPEFFLVEPHVKQRNHGVHNQNGK